MGMSIMTFVVMAALAIWFLATFRAGELNFRMPRPNQIGDTSLSPRSVNWLGALAFLGAVLICLLF